MLVPVPLAPRRMKLFFFLILGAAALALTAQPLPALSVVQTSPKSVRIEWTNTAAGFGLERSGLREDRVEHRVGAIAGPGRRWHSGRCGHHDFRHAQSDRAGRNGNYRTSLCFRAFTRAGCRH